MLEQKISRVRFSLLPISICLVLTSSVLFNTIVSSSPATAQTINEEDRAAEADRLLEQGRQQYQVSQWQEALQSWQEALELYRQLGDRAGEALTLNNIGIVNRALGNYPTALEYYQQSLVITRELGDRAEEALTLNNIGEVNRLLGNYPSALDYYQQVLVISREIGDRATEAAPLSNIGNVNVLLGNYPTALEYYQQSLVIVREIGDRATETKILNNIGEVNRLLGNYPSAFDYYQQSLVISREIGDRAAEAQTSSNIGIVNRLSGNYPSAFDYYQQSLVISREIGDRAAEARTLSSIGTINLSLGNYPNALDYYQQSLVILRGIGDRVTEAQVLDNIGIVNQLLGNYPSALDYHQQSLVIERELGERAGEAGTLNNIGIVNQLLGNYPSALDYYQQSLVISREIGDRATEAEILGNLGIVNHLLENYPSALDYYQQSLTITREIGDRATEAGILGNLGITFFQSGQAPIAIDRLFEALELLEALRPGELDDRDRISLFDIQLSTYRVLEQVLVDQGQLELAFEISERGRAQSFVQQLLSRRLPSQAPSLQPSIEALNLSQIQQIAQQHRATLVEYSLVDTTIGGPTLHIWVVQPTGELTLRQVNLSNLEIPLSRLVSFTHDALGTRHRGGFEIAATERPSLSEQLQQLHELLIAPIADLLPTDSQERVIFIPQGELFLVPFPALQNASGQYLIQNHTVLTAPAIQVLNLTRQIRTASSNPTPLQASDLLIVGNPVMPNVWFPAEVSTRQLPSLPGAEQEAQEIAQFFTTQALIGNQATEATLKQQMPEARVIHLATHGLLEYGEPEASGIRDVPGAVALTPGAREDGLLTASEIRDLNLTAELVVLSACDTGLGQITGDGVIGLSRSLIEAGTPSVIVSLWAIPDAPTAELMTEFYRQWQREGLDKAQALRQAMLITMETHPDPREWAAFTLIGEAE